MGTLDGAACVEAAKSADTLRIKVKNGRLSSQLYEKGVALLAEECNSQIQISCKRLADASEDCLSTPKFCRLVRLKLAPMVAANSAKDEEEKAKKMQEERKAKAEEEYLALQEEQVELHRKGAEAQIDIQKGRLEMEQRQIEIENQRETIRMIQTLFQ
jgi:hypothetical protein